MMRKLGGGAVLLLLLGLFAVGSVMAGPAGTEISKMEEQLAALKAAVLQLQADLTALAARVTALEAGGPQPPVTYPLTLNTGGTGQGTVSSGATLRGRPRTGQSYPAGTTVTLTATPAPGSTFTGWGPAPCAPSFVMPAAALACMGTFTVTAPPVGGSTWKRLPTGTDLSGTVSFTSLTWDSQRNIVIGTEWGEQPWCFNVATNVWAICMQKGPHHDFHNGGYAYDPVNDRHWVTTPQSTMIYWQRATGARVDHSTGGCGMDPAMIYDPTAKRFVCFGGWSVPPGPTVLTFALDPPATQWAYKAVPLGPSFANDASKMTFTRAGWDSKRTLIWYVDVDGSLWRLNPATLTWTQHATTGTKPQEYAVYVWHPVTDELIGWVGHNYAVNAGMPNVGKTYALNLSTLVWSEVVTPAPIPPTWVGSADNLPIWDPVGQRILLNTGPNYGRETWEFVRGGAGPGPAKHTLSIQPAGTGQGTTTGAGSYDAGTLVAMTATPGAGSTFAGWSGEADCSDGSVTMNANKACTATFTTTTPPVTGGCLPTTAKTFSPCVIPEDYNASPFASASKDLMWTWDSKRKLILVGMGDNTNTYAVDSGNNVLWGYDASTNGWSVVSTYCHAPDTVTPNHPTDYGIMVYDPGRDRVWWLGQGDGYPPGQDGVSCWQGAPGWPRGSIRRNGFLWLNPGMNTWTKVSEQATSSIGGAYYDTTGDRILTVELDNFLNEWPMAAMPSVRKQIAHLGDVVPAPVYAGGVGGWLPTEYPARVKWAWDDVGRIAYLPLVFRRLDGPGNVVESGVWMVTVNTVTKAVTLRARAPTPPDVWMDPYLVMSVWDSVNKKVIYPVMSTSCGKIEKMLVYHPTTDTWEETPVPPGTHGATIAYDPARNVVMLGGRIWCEGSVPPPNPAKVYLWRYAP